MADSGTGGRSGGGPRIREVPAGDNRMRLVCPDCGFINYENPKIVVGSVVTWQGKFLLCRRAINPRKGHWTIPAGFLELNESVLDGARREAVEEACADIEIDALLAVYNVPRISQVQLIYRATLRQGTFAPGEESLEVALFDWDDLPWQDLAFPSVLWALRHFDEVRGMASFAPRGNPPDDAAAY
jgi:ADP-ribose pyrophosphatase YjhB (NUDIX family)